MEIEKIAVSNAQQTKLYNIHDIVTLDRNKINDYQMYILCKNGRLEFIHSSIENKRIISTREAIKKYNLIFTPSTNFCVQLCLHDTWNKDGILTFGKTKDMKSVCFPDLYQLENYGDKIDYAKQHEQPFHNKIKKIIFAGGSTGSMKLENNNRVNMCIWSVKDSWAKQHTSIKITNIVQVNKTYFQDYLHNLNLQVNAICSKNSPISEQLNYKYILSIDGNTFAWDRPIWVMASKSILFKHTKNDNHFGWYYELLKPMQHYVDISEHSIENQFNFLENNQNIADNMIQKANQFVDTYCSKHAVHTYLHHFFTNVAERY
jgi:hypothetical protein